MDPRDYICRTPDEYDRCGHDSRQFHPSCTASRRTASLPGLAYIHLEEEPSCILTARHILLKKKEKYI